MHRLPVPEGRRQRPRCGRGWFLLRLLSLACRQRSSPRSSSGLLSVGVCVHSSSSRKDISRPGLEPTLVISVYLDSLWKNPVSKCGCILGSWELGLQQTNSWGRHNRKEGVIYSEDMFVQSYELLCKTGIQLDSKVCTTVFCQKPNPMQGLVCV